jgi:hypothetical protein
MVLNMFVAEYIIINAEYKDSINLDLFNGNEFNISQTLRLNFDKKKQSR